MNGIAQQRQLKFLHLGHPSEGNNQQRTLQMVRQESVSSMLYSYCHTDLLHCITRTENAAIHVPATKAMHQAAYLRSFKMPIPKASIAPKVAQALGEIGIQLTRLVMPTRENCMQLEGLLEATCALVETKKVVDKVEHDIRVMKERLGLRKSVAAAGEDGEADAEGEVEEEAETIMQVDAEEGADRDAEGERATSVVSTRSGRSRKHVCFLTSDFILRLMAVSDTKVDVHLVCGHFCDCVNTCRDEEAETCSACHGILD